jgi:hypothetical protein
MPFVSTAVYESFHAVDRLGDRKTVKVQPAANGVLPAPELANLASIDAGRNVTVRHGTRLRQRLVSRSHVGRRRRAFGSSSRVRRKRNDVGHRTSKFLLLLIAMLRHETMLNPKSDPSAPKIDRG